MPIADEKIRLKDIDRLKGFAIFLVVLGHLTLKSRPADIEWYILIEDIIYKFHMALFMFLTGFIMMHTYPLITSFNDYLLFIKKKFIRLIPALLMMSAAIAIGKIVFNNIIVVDNPQCRILSGFFNTIIIPSKSHARSMWYINVVFAYYILIPPLMILIKKKTSALFVIGLLLYLGLVCKIMPTTNYFAINKIMRYLIFFSFGMFAYKNIKRYYKILDTYGAIFLVLFILVMLIFFEPGYRIDIQRLIIGISAITAFCYIIRLELFNKSNLLLVLGVYTFPIYLMNTIAIGLTKGIILHFTTLDGINFIFMSPVLLLNGILLPIIIKKYLFSKIKIIDYITN